MSGLNGIFIKVELDDGVRGDVELARKLEEVCPVDIFTAGEGGVAIAEQNLDECVLCNLCVEAAPAGALTILRLYE